MVRRQNPAAPAVKREAEEDWGRRQKLEPQLLGRGSHAQALGDWGDFPGRATVLLTFARPGSNRNASSVSISPRYSPRWLWARPARSPGGWFTASEKGRGLESGGGPSPLCSSLSVRNDGPSPSRRRPTSDVGGRRWCPAARGAEGRLSGRNPISASLMGL